MRTLTECENIIRNVLLDSPYCEKYVWDTELTAQLEQDATLDRTNGIAMTVFLAEILQDNNAPCVEEVIGLLEEFVQECTATEKSALLGELSNALNNAC
ncbi:hypothetical protein [Halodesulfovibrio marinisediminis]|uniref:Uncharacterized protein n=1 Tax=Halodesulfovibrio marinisediminis DSM 17456 TaxID=1121457 RepID=A0A1N6I774_9BACT|nr:hypothetical protein [Halodesulfovibrio marinisediminis]SIO27850.1 hypothetical protein SAMN02745161_2473 [Halodesulfovibrio marinisediminis DSM 17456]